MINIILFSLGCITGSSFIFLAFASVRGSQFLLEKYTFDSNRNFKNNSHRSIGKRRGFGSNDSLKIVRKRRGFGA